MFFHKAQEICLHSHTVGLALEEVQEQLQYLFLGLYAIFLSLSLGGVGLRQALPFTIENGMTGIKKLWESDDFVVVENVENAICS